MKVIKKPSLWAMIYGSLLTLFTAFVILETFVIPQAYEVVEGGQVSSQEMDLTSLQASSQEYGLNELVTTNVEETELVVTDTSYEDGNVSITLTEYRAYDTTIYVADILLSSSDYLATGLADNTYGKNIKDKTSTIATDQDAILAINGDFYGAQNDGYVIRNGVLYRSTSSDSDQEDLVIYSDGSLEVIREGSVTAEALLEAGAVQVLSFGPGLIEAGEIGVTENDEVGKAMASNPRTAIGLIDDLHYVMVVSDGRTSESAGLTLYELATFMKDLDVYTAYNLDGGGSSTMYFNGQVINKPTTNGKKISERSVSDIVYIGSSQ